MSKLHRVRFLSCLVASSAQVALAAAATNPSSATSASVPSQPATASPQLSPPQSQPVGSSLSPNVPGETCVEHLPQGKARPELTERFPARGTSGHQAKLELTFKHGKGERVLPGALAIQSDSDAARALRRAGFMLPSVQGPARPRVKTRTEGGMSVTEVEVSVVPLPEEAGRHELVLPPLPIALARASGEVITLCTQPHAITVEDPVVNKPMAMPKANPEPQRQVEPWVALRNLVYGGVAGLVLAAILALLYRWWRLRPRKVAPPPPPRPAWELALESLHDIRQAQLVEQGRLHDHFDRVSHTLKEYLGRRFGFDGLESTTSEILSHLQQSPEATAALPSVHDFLLETDLVKFAKQPPTEAQCRGLLERAEAVVRESTPTAAQARAAEGTQ